MAGARNGFAIARRPAAENRRYRDRPDAETARSSFEPRKSREIGAYSSETENRQFVQECVVVDAVAISNPSQFPYSLLTGKLTGNFGESGLARRFSRAVCQLIQWFEAKFPRQRNREFFEHNREFLGKEQGISAAKCCIWNSETATAPRPRLGRSRAAAVRRSTWDDSLAFLRAAFCPRSASLLAARSASLLAARSASRLAARSASFFALFTSAGFLFVARALFALGRDAELPDTTSASGAFGSAVGASVERGLDGLEAVCSPPVACLREVAGSAP